MKKNSGNFSVEEIMALANSEAGQKLIALLKEQDSPELRKAAAHAASGNYEDAKNTVTGALSSPQIRAIIEQLRRQSNG